jgi:hypothetical protein
MAVCYLCIRRRKKLVNALGSAPVAVVALLSIPLAVVNGVVHGVRRVVRTSWISTIIPSAFNAGGIVDRGFHCTGSNVGTRFAADVGAILLLAFAFALAIVYRIWRVPRVIRVL